MNGPVIGYESRNYGAARNTYAPVVGVRHVKIGRVPIGSISPRFRHLDRAFVPFGPSNCDLVHLWNRTSFGRHSWGASFESMYPYFESAAYPNLARRFIQRAKSDRCRFLIAISEYARRSLQANVGSEEWSELISKVHVVSPHHEIPTDSIDMPLLADSQPLRMLFVGVTFFGKGGEAVLKAVEHFGDELNLELLVVSPVAGDDYSGTPPAATDPAEIRRRLSDHPRITWVQRLPHYEVLSVMRQHHLGLLPTLADTYGYVALEFMGLGVPTVVTNVQALPSFTGPDTGWVIDVETDDIGRWVGRGPGREHRAESYERAMADLLRGVERTLRAIRSRPESLRERSLSARARAEGQFDASTRGATLRAIYEDALG